MATKKTGSTGLRKLMEDQLADIYYAEKQVLKALPKMAKNASNEDLSAAFTEHAEETQVQIERLEQMFEAMGLPAKGKKCPAIDGILEEGKEIMEEFADDAALDAGLVAAAQKVEHYEIASYGSMAAWAEQLGLDDVLALVNETLEEEKAADEKLTEIAESVVNIEADEDDGDDEDEGELVEMDGATSRTSKSRSSSSKTAAKSATKSASKSASNGSSNGSSAKGSQNGGQNKR
jgi:ferritin-like metal-binding protein YciE